MVPLNGRFVTVTAPLETLALPPDTETLAVLTDAGVFTVIESNDEGAAVES